MSILPKTEDPIYTIITPVTKQEVKFRPYKVKEQKLLMMAAESGDQRYLIDTINQIISNCVLSQITTPLTITDSEFLFYNLRARSDSEYVELRYRCQNIVGEDYCDNLMQYRLNLLTDLDVTEGVNSTIKLDDKLIVKMKHQRFEYDALSNKDDIVPDDIFESIANQIEYIYIDDTVFNVDDIPKSDLIEWLGDLSLEKYSKIEEFVNSEPKIHKSIEIKCKKCGTEHKIDVENIFDFFI